jgi:dipeptidyl aminopeptidase/acylaminoacyl peptidase
VGGLGGGAGGGRGGAENRLSPDGRWVLFVKDGQIHRAAVDPGNTDPKTIDEAPPFFTTLGVNSDPVWSPDSKKVAFVTGRYDERQYFPTQGQVTTHSLIGVYDVDSRTISYLAPSVDRDTSPTWSADGRQIAFIRRPGLPFGHFATARLETIGRDQVPAGFLTAKFAGGYNTSFMVADAATGEAREIWHNTPTDNVFARVARVEWQADRLVFEATVNSWPKWYSVALANAAADPVLLTAPDAAIEHTAFSSDGKWLYWSSNVGEPDRRHLWRISTAGGQAQQVTKGEMVETAVAVPGSGQTVALEQAGPRQPVTVSVMPAAGEYLKARPDVDPARIGVWGLSYGGWLTGEALSRNSDLFKAGAIHAGVQLRSTSLDPQNLAFQSSPAFNIEKWTSPTLIAHGDDDRNVEFSQTIGVIQLLRARNVPHKLMVFPDETHYYMKFSRWPAEFVAIDQWFDQWLQHKQPTTTTTQGNDR